MEKTIYDLKLHEVLAVEPPKDGGTASNYYTVLRVPGGWIYQTWDTQKQDLVREIFVPFNNEFQKEKELPY